MEKEDVLKALMQVEDPDIGLDVVSLGLIYEINIKEDEVQILFTLTTPACPYADFLVEEVRDAVQIITKKKVNVQLTFTPPWTPEKIDPDLRAALNL